MIYKLTVRRGAHVVDSFSFWAATDGAAKQVLSNYRYHYGNGTNVELIEIGRLRDG